MQQNIDNCNKECIEIKGTTKLKPSDKRRIYNLIKRQNNYDYSIMHQPILSGPLKINYTMYNSKFNYGIQSADFMAHYLHGEYQKHLNTGKDITSTISFIEVKLFLP